MLQIFEYESSPMQFEVIDGHVMANATLMAKVFNRKPDDIFKTKSWIEFESVVLEDLKCRFEDIRSVKNGGNEFGSWIHEELVIEFARRLNPKFSLWCNRKIAEILKNGNARPKQLSPAELFLQSAKQHLEHERELQELKKGQQEMKLQIEQLTASTTTRPDYFTVAGYATLHKIQVTNSTASGLSRKASNICKKSKVEIEDVKDPRWGVVKSYPSTVLQEVFKSKYPDTFK